MREILFRGQDLQEQNGWLYGYFYKSDINKRERKSGKASLIFTPNCDTFIYVPEYHNSWMVKAETVGQYTGLKDKNGTKIFEDDIIRDEDGDTMVVKWLTESAAFVLEPKPYASLYFYGTLSSRIEVIGNIHDNPEFLERGAENE